MTKRMILGLLATAALLTGPLAGWAKERPGAAPPTAAKGFERSCWRGSGWAFRRVATFPVFRNGSVEEETVCEIVAASENGRTLLYTDAAQERLGFVDITDPTNPLPAGTLALAGEPTSVAVRGRHALVCVDTSPDFVNPSGELVVVDVATRTVVRTIALGGQPDSIKVSPDHRYAAIAIENQRDEDLGDGAPPQAPAGFLAIVDLVGAPAAWTLRTVDLTGVCDRFPEDPEPEFVDVNARNVAAVTCQENNHVILVDLRTGAVVGDFSVGAADLDGVDTVEDDRIVQGDLLLGVRREPDAIAWIGRRRLATADEGDLDGGSRGFTLFEADTGAVVYEAGNELERLAARIGHYPEGRSENKGGEPEGILAARYGPDRLLFVGLERASFVAVYELDRDDRPTFVQALPGGVGPEGLLAIPQRGLFVTASENDDRGAAFRSVLTIFERVRGEPDYPTVVSADDANGRPIAWVALSALAADPQDAGRAYTAHDSFLRGSRLFELDVSDRPAVITREIALRDAAGDLVDLDVEGVSVAHGGGFWVVSEGRGSVDDPARPVTSTNLLLRVAGDGAILATVPLPPATDLLQRRFGLEGVAAAQIDGREKVFVAFQREWVADAPGGVRIGCYDTLAGTWGFARYPLDPRESPNGGWVGLSELTWLGGGRLLVLERDNQGGTDARIKRLYEVSVAGVPFAPEGAAFPALTKTLVRDLLPDLAAPRGAVLEKVEGCCVLADGRVLIVTDNDGVDDHSGETQLLDLGAILDD